MGEGIRCDSGVREGSEISVFYDPMICKLVTYGKNRAEAINLGKKALDSYVIQGVSHNIPLLRDILSEVSYFLNQSSVSYSTKLFLQESYVKGDTNTSYLPRVYPNGFTIPKLSESHFLLLQGVASALEVNRNLRLQQRSSTPSSWDFVVLSEGGATTPINVAQTETGFSVNSKR